MEQGKQKPHFLLVTFPAQGHINPALQFAKRLVWAGAHVTFSTSISGKRCLDKADVPDGLDFAPFSDGYDDGFQHGDGDVITYMSKFKQSGSDSVGQVFERSRAEGKQVTCCVYTLLLPWAAQVARDYHVPSALLWIQPASVFDVYYYYFRGYGEVIDECENNPSWSLDLPNLPFTLKARDLPSFLLASTPPPYKFAIPTFQAQIEELEKEDTPTILVNTFHELEIDALNAINRFTLIPVGPLLSSGDESKENDYMSWLDAQNESSVVYVSFGSMSVLSGPQQQELARALIKTHKPFLWVIRVKEENKNDNDNVDEGDWLSIMEDLKQQGMIVPWCSQVDVLSHPSVGCFVTHCGWNSTLESITCGVPMVAFPQWTDQTTNAKLVQDVWRIGVRLEISEEQGLVKEEEIKRCLELVMESQEMNSNALKWKELAVEAAKHGGGSDMNLRTFINQVASLQQTTATP